MAAPVTEEQCLPSYKYMFNSDLLRGKVAFITGGGSGIGFTITEIFMRHGCDTVIASRSQDRVDAAAKTLTSATGRRCLAQKVDIRKPQEVIGAVDAALAEYGRIDILVNCAAGNFLCPLEGLSFNGFRTVLEIDTAGTFNASKTVFDKYLKDNGGVILNITSTLQFRGSVYVGHAAAAKAAIDSLTRSMAVEWGQYGIRSVGLAPGPIADTEGMRRLGGRHEAQRKDYEMLIPFRRMGSRVEVAHSALFLVSDLASYVTGETLVCDGGQWLGTPNAISDQKQASLMQPVKGKL